MWWALYAFGCVSMLCAVILVASIATELEKKMDIGKIAGALTGKPALETMKPEEATGYRNAMRASLGAQIAMMVVAGMSLDDCAAMLNGCMDDAAQTAQMLGRK